MSGRRSSDATAPTALTSALVAAIPQLGGGPRTIAALIRDLQVAPAIAALRVSDAKVRQGLEVIAANGFNVNDYLTAPEGRYRVEARQPKHVA